MADPITMTAMALMAAGSVVKGAGTIYAGTKAEESAEFKARQLEQAADESRAAAQRQAFDRRKQAEDTLSRIRARAAAFSGDATNPSIVKLESDVAGRGEYYFLSEMYSGENRARGLEDAAMGARAEGRAAKTGSYFSAAGTILSGAGSMAATYGKTTSGSAEPREPYYG